MEPRELEAFRAVVETGGVGTVAAQLNRAQSSITARIRQLESSLGVQLLERDGRKLRPTSVGDTLLDYSVRVLDLAEATRTAVQRDHVCGRLRLGSNAAYPDGIDHAAWPPPVFPDGTVRLSAPYNGRTIIR